VHKGRKAAVYLSAGLFLSESPPGSAIPGEPSPRTRQVPMCSQGSRYMSACLKVSQREKSASPPVLRGFHESLLHTYCF